MTSQILGCCDAGLSNISLGLLHVIVIYPSISDDVMYNIIYIHRAHKMLLLLLMKSHKSFSLARSPLLPAGVGGFICTHLERPWIGSSSRGVIETLETWKIYENMGWTSLFFRGYFLLSKESSGSTNQVSAVSDPELPIKLPFRLPFRMSVALRKEVTDIWKAYVDTFQSEQSGRPGTDLWTSVALA